MDAGVVGTQDKKQLCRMLQSETRGSEACVCARKIEETNPGVLASYVRTMDYC